MEQLTFVLDIGSGATKLVAGYVLERQPIVIEALSAFLSNQIENGRIRDISASADIIKKLLMRMEKSVNQKIESVFLALPSNGLQVFQATKTMNIVSPQSKISQIDLNNLSILFKREKPDDNHAHAGIVPEVFELDDDRLFDTTPLGETSDYITLTANVLFTDKVLQEDYRALCEQAGVKIRRVVVDAHAITELLALDESAADEYVLIDIGAGVTSLAFIGGHRLLGATHFDMGANHLIEQVALGLNIGRDEAMRLVIDFGYDARDNYFDGIVYQRQSAEAEGDSIHQSDLNRIIEAYFQTWSDELHRYVGQLGRQIDNSLNLSIFNWIIVGGGTRLLGFDALLSRFGQHEQYKRPSLNVMGARHSNYFTAIGVLYVANKYATMSEEKHIQVTSVERVKSNKIVTSYNEYEDEL